MGQEDLTARQREALASIADLTRRLERPPTVSELAARLDISRQNARALVWRLKRSGYVNFKAQDRQALTPVLTPKAKAQLGHEGLAVLGSIAAGEPIYASEALERYAERLSDLLPVQPGDFILQVEGRSMSGAGYLPGDYVVVRPTQRVQDGDIVVAFLPDDESATLKRLYHQGDELFLVAQHGAYKPVRLKATEVRLQGVVVGHIGARRDRLPLRELLAQSEANTSK